MALIKVVVQLWCEANERDFMWIEISAIKQLHYMFYDSCSCIIIKMFNVKDGPTSADRGAPASLAAPQNGHFLYIQT